jgi:CHAT domain-containing protein
MILDIPIPTLDELIQAVRNRNLEEELVVIEKVMNVFRSRNIAAQRQLLEQCPLFSDKEQLLEVISLNNQAAHINTLGILAIAYSWTPSRELGVIFGKSGYSLANDYRRNPESALTPEILLTALSQSSLGCSTALYKLGRYEELLEFSKSALDCLEQGSSLLESSTDEQSKAMVRDNLNSLRLDLIDANIQCQRYEQAQALTESQKKYIDQLTEPNLSRFESLQVLLSKLIVSPAVFPSEPALSTENKIAALNAIKFAKQIADSMASSGCISEIEQVRHNIDTAAGIFLDPKKEHDPVLIEQSLVTLQQALQWTRKNHFLEEECEALWGLSICYRRQEKIQPNPCLQKELVAKSVEMLLALRKNIELIRSRIVDPYQRVHWIKCYGYLFPILCKQLHKLDRPLELLDAIEGAKGRVLADVLTRKDDQPIADFDFSASVQQLPALMQQVGAHYLTYLVDDEETFVVLVTKDGSLHTHSVPIGKTQLKQWLSDDSEYKSLLDPRNWGKEINKKERLPNLSELLAPFVSWLEPYTEAGLIQHNDHLCYSPDAFLHLIPLHCLPFLDKPLVCHVSVSRIHGAAALVELLKHPPEKPSRLTAIYVPAKDDLKNPKGLGQQKLDNMRWTAYWLKEIKNMVGTITSEEAADLSAVTQLSFSQRLVHFSTHGIVPSENEQNQDSSVNPYNSSGLVLAKDGKLPERGDGQGGSLLTPEKIISGKLNFAGSHVTMGACVSGRAKEGIGGDAIGLDWALMLAKASSVLSTHWYVDADVAKVFSQSFYQYWLFENHYSRAQAWRKTILDLMEDKKASPYNWAAFSLSGDWR